MKIRVEELGDRRSILATLGNETRERPIASPSVPLFLLLSFTPGLVATRPQTDRKAMTNRFRITLYIRSYFLLEFSLAFFLYYWRNG